MIETIQKKIKYMSKKFFFHCEYFVNKNFINKCQNKNNKMFVIVYMTET